ncbi:phage tail tube protein [Xanthobacter autotrophicus]|uniref:phage tail tube protein n=1 Tax=Xanthobacter autotrophicus TaxID=280 RepID=UPI003727972F
MTASTSAGAKIYIGTTTAISFSNDAAALSAFEADTYTQVKEVEDLGEFGDESAEVTFATMEDSRTRRYKGTRDAGVLALVCGRDPLDAGQRAAIAAEKSQHAYNFKVLVNDAPVGGTPTIFYFRAKVMSAKVTFGTVDDIVKITFNLGIDSSIIEDVAVGTP